VIGNGEKIPKNCTATGKLGEGRQNASLEEATMSLEEKGADPKQPDTAQEGHGIHWSRRRRPKRGERHYGFAKMRPARKKNHTRQLEEKSTPKAQ